MHIATTAQLLAQGCFAFDILIVLKRSDCHVPDCIHHDKTPDADNNNEVLDTLDQRQNSLLLQMQQQCIQCAIAVVLKC